jgi:hypothetical protein
MEERAELIKLRCSHTRVQYSAGESAVLYFGLRLIYWLTASICFVKEGGCTAAS